MRTHMHPRRHALPVAIAALVLLAFPLAAQEPQSAAETPVRRIISIGHYPRVDGLRLNFRDRDLELVRGANVTIWHPHQDDLTGDVRGFALGLPTTGAGSVEGLALGVFGVGASRHLHGINLGGLGVGAGGSVRGISLGGLGVGAGADVRGLAIGGLGAGAGGSVRGIAIGGLGAGAGGSVRGAMVGGLGAGAGGDARGLFIGGLGAGAGGNVRGMALGGVGVGAGGNLRGLSVAGVGVGAGGDISGLTIAGIGIGSGGRLHGISLAGIGVGAPRVDGGAVATIVGAERARGVFIAPAMFRIENDGRFTGGSLSTVNLVRGHQTGLSIGVVNYAQSLRGVQFGLVNIVRDNPAPYRVLPIMNAGTAR